MASGVPATAALTVRAGSPLRAQGRRGAVDRNADPDAARGAWVDPALGRMAFGEWAVRWEAGLNDLRPTTRALNLGVLRNHLLPRFAGWPLAHHDLRRQRGSTPPGGDVGSSGARRVDRAR